MEAFKNNEKRFKFSQIETPEELVEYLDDVKSRLKNAKFLYHYTTLSNAISIFQSHSWHLFRAEDMNDLVEFNSGDKERWRNIFFASFMSDSKESIGMWSMYSQPWQEGVKISIPKNTMFQWIRNIDEIIEISKNNYQPTGRKIKVEQASQLRLSCVAYSNSSSLESAGSEELVTWSNQYNRNVKGTISTPCMTGYVKDKAWDYEKEVCMKAEFDNAERFKRVAVRVPDEVLNQMTITAGPLFEGDLIDKIENRIGGVHKVEDSLFRGKLRIKNVQN
jgi:hypothetical protein